MSRLTDAINQAKAQGRVAMIPYLPAGFPSKEGFFEALDELDAAGADIIEIGVPFSDPVADGPVVEQAALECLERGVCLAWIFDELKKRKGRYKARLVLMGYYNPFLQHGLKRLAADADAAGVAGFIVPDVPLEETGELRAELSAKNIDLVALVGLNTEPERLAAYARAATGFVYFVSVLGVTGARDKLPEEIADRMKLVKSVIDLPLALGFGIKHPAQLEQFGGLADAVVIGSALISHVRQGGSITEFFSVWR